MWNSGWFTPLSAAHNVLRTKFLVIKLFRQILNLLLTYLFKQLYYTHKVIAIRIRTRYIKNKERENG